MDGLRIIPVTNEELIFSVSALADEIWHEHFSSILSTEQIDYMLFIWDLFTENEKPEWLSREQIIEFGKRMGVEVKENE